MPITLEPGRTFRVVLESDKAKPADQQCFFELRYLSGRDWKKVTRIADSIESSKDGAEAIDKIFEVLAVGLCGWGNLIDPESQKPIKYDPKELDRILTMTEANELLVKFRNQGIEACEVKN